VVRDMQVELREERHPIHTRCQAVRV